MMETMMRQEFVRGLVQRAIVCQLSGKVLDFRRCGVVIDEDGDPIDVFHETMLDRVRVLLKGKSYRAEVAPFAGAS